MWKSNRFFKSKHNFKLVVINNVDIMSESVQFSLRRTIEQYSDQCRFIIISNSCCCSLVQIALTALKWLNVIKSFSFSVAAIKFKMESAIVGWYWLFFKFSKVVKIISNSGIRN